MTFIQPCFKLGKKLETQSKIISTYSTMIISKLMMEVEKDKRQMERTEMMRPQGLEYIYI